MVDTDDTWRRMDNARGMALAPTGELIRCLQYLGVGMQENYKHYILNFGMSSSWDYQTQVMTLKLFTIYHNTNQLP